MKNILSVIIPVYNSKDTIKKCAESIMKQTLHDIEIIFVDDCSKDGTIEILDELKASDKRISVIKNEENLGTGRARNRGLLRAKGKYIGFVDDDDWIDSNYFESLIMAAEKSNADVCVSLSIKNHKGKKIIPHTIIPNDLRETIFVERTPPWAKIYRRDFFYENKISFGTTRGEDILPAFLCAFLTSNFAYSSDSFYHCNLRDNSVSHRTVDSSDLKELSIYKKMVEYAKDSINREYWVNLVKKRSMISFDFLYKKADKPLRKKIVKEYEAIFKDFSLLNYYFWKICYKLSKLKTYFQAK